MILIISSIIISLIFVGVGFYYLRTIKSLKDFFYYRIPNNKRKLIISLVAANLTLGTGLVYLAQGGFSYGILFLIVPLSTGIGYYLLSKFLSYVDYNDDCNYFEFIDNQILEHNNKTVFKKAITIILLVTFVLVLSYEIFASAKILAPLIFNSNELFFQIIISAFIILVALIYTITSGLKGVIMNDILQIVLILAALLFLVFGNQNIDFKSAISNIHSKLYFDNFVIWITVFLAAINAITTQFYSILNHGVISNAHKADRNLILKRTGISSAILLTIFILFGLILQNDESIMNFTNLLSNSYSKAALVLITIGFLSIIYSTLDSLLIMISMFFHKNILNKDITDKIDKNGLNNVRAIISFTFIFIFALLAFFFYFKADLFNLLLGIGSGISVVVPLIILSGYLFKKGKISLLKNKHIWVFVFLFIIAHVLYLGAIATPSLHSYLAYISYFFLSISTIYSFYLSKTLKNG